MIEGMLNGRDWVNRIRGWRMFWLIGIDGMIRVKKKRRSKVVNSNLAENRIITNINQTQSKQTISGTKITTKTNLNNQPLNKKYTKTTMTISKMTKNSEITIMKKIMITIMVVDIMKILGKIMMRGMREMREGEMIMMIDGIYFFFCGILLFIFYWDLTYLFLIF